MEIKNIFDYTSVPRELLYFDRRNLDAYGVDENPSLNYYIEEILSEKYANICKYEEFATSIFDCAYYICTVAYTDNHPERRFGALLWEADTVMRHNSDYIASVLAVALLQMWARRFDKSHQHLKRLFKQLEDELRENHFVAFNSFYVAIKQKMITSGLRKIDSVDEFKPRSINRKVLKNIDYWDWTKQFGTDMDKMLEFIFAIGKNEEEQKTIAAYMREVLHPAFKNGGEYNYCFEYIERQIYLQFHADEEKAKIEAEIDAEIEQEYQQQFELDFYREEFPKLKKENECLRVEVAEIKNRLEDTATDEDINAIFETTIQKQPQDSTETQNEISGCESSNFNLQLLEAQNKIKEQDQTIQEQEEEIKRLKEEKLSNKSDEQFKKELNRIKEKHEDTLVALLKPAFFNIEDDAREFLSRIHGLDNQGVTDVAWQFLHDKKITPSKKGRFIWNVLTAAKLYNATEQNWTAALRKAN